MRLDKKTQRTLRAWEGDKKKQGSSWPVKVNIVDEKEKEARIGAGEPGEGLRDRRQTIEGKKRGTHRGRLD